MKKEEKKEAIYLFEDEQSFVNACPLEYQVKYWELKKSISVIKLSCSLYTKF